MAQLFTKLLNVQKKVRALAKDSKGDGDKFAYVSGAKLLGIIRPAMDDEGLILVPEVVNIFKNEPLQITNSYGKTRTEVLTTLMMRFTWVDCESGEKLDCSFAATGINGLDKGIGSAITYGERYFLLKFFHIATDEDDVDALPNDDKQAVPLPLPMPQVAPQAAPVAKPKRVLSAAFIGKNREAMCSAYADALKNKKIPIADWLTTVFFEMEKGAANLFEEVYNSWAAEQADKQLNQQ